MMACWKSIHHTNLMTCRKWWKPTFLVHNISFTTRWFTLWLRISKQCCSCFECQIRGYIHKVSEVISFSKFNVKSQLLWVPQLEYGHYTCIVNEWLTSAVFFPHSWGDRYPRKWSQLECSVYVGILLLTHLVLGPWISWGTRSLWWLVMPWLLVAPEHQQLWYWLRNGNHDLMG